MSSQSSRATLALFVVAFALAPFGCKRKMDVDIPNSTASATTTTPSAKPSASASAAAADDSAEPLAQLSSARVVAPPPAAATGAKPATSGTATAAAAPQPQECSAAVLMRKLGKASEAETLRIKCVEKGGKDPFPK
jgi:hypothetical protein